MPVQGRRSRLFTLIALSFAALAIHGYHPAVEDAEIYLPGVLKQLNPQLFPYNDQFFASHAGMTFFPRIMATFVRLTHLPLGLAMLGCHVLSIFFVLWACERIARACFEHRYAVWCGVAVVAALLTIPVAGTSLFLLDQYVTARSFSTPFSLLAIASAVERRSLSCAAWTVATALVHPLMTVFTLSYLLLFFLPSPQIKTPASALTFPSIFPLWLFQPATPAYHRVLGTRPLHLITNWTWYEWLGAVGPLLLLVWLDWLGRRRRMGTMSRVCGALICFELLFVAAALLISRPGRLEQLSELQPMRSLHLVYILMFLLWGAWVGESFLRGKAWRWMVFFAPLCFGMWFVQRQLFPSSAHLEWPWASSSNAWVQAFEWIRTNTPTDAYFALDPNHMALPGNDQHGFRAIAERSMLADAVKDSGAASMFPQLAEDWATQVDAQLGWKHFDRAQFAQLNHHFGVTWVVLERPGVDGLLCPYQSTLLLVCRLD